MKIIGIDANGNYIAVVTHTELEKCADKFYGKLEKLRCGDFFDIGAGYDFSDRIAAACKGIQDGHANFLRASETMTRFASMVAERKRDAEPGIAA